MRRRYVVVMVMLVDGRWTDVRQSRRFWTRRGAEQWARFYERESWRLGFLVDAWAVRLPDSKGIDSARHYADAMFDPMVLSESDERAIAKLLHLD